MRYTPQFPGFISGEGIHRNQYRRRCNNQRTMKPATDRLVILPVTPISGYDDQTKEDVNCQSASSRTDLKKQKMKRVQNGHLF